MNNYKKILLITLSSAFLLGYNSVLKAQTVDASPEVSNICFGASANLTATYSGPVVTATTNYTISTVPYNPDPLTGGTSVTLSDDSQTGMLPIGFNFCFFGNTYSQFIIGSNNWIGFQSGETSTWVTAAIPNTSGTVAPRNTIMGAWQDINPGVGGTVKYAVYGVAPNRRLSVSWNNVPMFSCTGQLYSSQIIIYEGTNIIETHIANKSLCTTWNSGNAVHGLHNSTGTVAVVVPGRNNTQWTATNEAKRFTPSGPATSTINWYILPANTLVGTGTSITVTPPSGAPSTSYYAQVTSTGTCVSGFGTDTVVVIQTNCAPCTTTATNGGAVCVGSSINLFSTTTTVSGVASYAWTGPGGYTSNVQNPVIPSATLAMAGTYTVTVTENNGSFCTSTTTVVVNPIPPAPVAGNNGPVCSGSTLNLTAAPVTGGTYSWTGPGAFTSGTQNPSIPSVTNAATGTYSVTVTVNGCTSPAGTTSVIINNTPSPPIPSINASTTPAPVCQGATLLLTANNIAGATYSWTGPNSYAAAVRNPPPLTGATPVMGGTYSLTVTVGGCTSNPATVSIVVNATPAAPTASGVTICSGVSATLTASAPGGTYDWYDAATGGTLQGTGSSFTTPVLTSTTTYYVQSTISGCVGPRTSVTVTVSPSFTVVTTADDSICNGTSATLGVLSPSGSYTYSWDAPASPAFSTSASPVVTPATTSTYTVTVTDPAGCTGSDVVTLSVGTPLVVSASGVPSNCFASCDGTGSVAVSGSFSPYSYSWSTGSSSASVSGLCAGTQTVTVTDLIGCTAQDTIQIQEPAIITLTTSSITAHCSLPDGSATVSATGGVSPYTYLWSPGGQTTATAINLIPGTYTVVVTDNHSCQMTASVTVANAPGVTATISSTPITCNAGCDGTATITPAGGIAPYTYSWTGGLTTATITGICAGTYNATVTDSAGCTATISLVLTQPSAVFVDALPPVPPICIGQSATLNATATGGTVGSGYVFNWTSPAFTGNPNVVSPGSTTSYTVSATDGNGCLSVNTQSVTVTVRPPLSVVASSDENICEGDNTLISAVGMGGDGSYTYTWSPGGTSATGSLSVSPMVTTTYTITLTDGCTTLPATDVVTITVKPLPLVTFSSSALSGCAPLCVSLNDLTTISGGSITGWSWTVDGTNYSSQNANHCFVNAGVYSVTLSDTSNFGCTSSLTMNNMITVYAMPVANFVYSPEPASINYPTVQFTDQSLNATAWSWNFGDALSALDSTSNNINPDHTYSDVGIYCVELIVTNTPACADTITHCLEIHPDFTLYIPNAFSPNGSGLNDEFYVKGENIDKFEMMIYDRWGNMVFRSENINDHWKGNVKGGSEIAQEDVYVYIINLKDKVGERHQYIGHVTIVK
jgi:gliding motility-associated-like protein